LFFVIAFRLPRDVSDWTHIHVHIGHWSHSLPLYDLVLIAKATGGSLPDNEFISSRIWIACEAEHFRKDASASELIEQL
jgi:hypothetical protein